MVCSSYHSLASLSGGCSYSFLEEHELPNPPIGRQSSKIVDKPLFNPSLSFPRSRGFS